MSKLFSAKFGKSEKILVSGNEAIVRGLLESGVGFGSTYPGTPVSEIGDLLHLYSQTEFGSNFIFDYALNEKVVLHTTEKNLPTIQNLNIKTYRY